MDAPGDGDRGSILPESAAERIEDLLRQFVGRAHELLQAQEHMRGLLSAVIAIAEDLELEAMLDRVVRSARDLVKAKYAALGVLNPEGTALSHFITLGMPEEIVREIGPRPTGHGVLGLLIREPVPIRLHDLGTHPASYGFPSHHPPMKSFLGVPVRVRGEVFGNLYLTEKADGEDFTAEDEDLVVALAAAAGIAIQNARLFDSTGRRQRWLEASMDIAGSLLDLDDHDEGVRAVAEGALGLADAALAAVLKPWGNESQPSWGAIAGEAHGAVDDDAWARAAELAAEVAEGRNPIVVPAPDLFGGSEEHCPFSQALLVPVGFGLQDHGTLLLARRSGAALFPPVDVEMSFVYCAQASLALQIARSHRAREELLVFTDRDRIARELHDGVVQRLFAAGLSLQGLRQFAPEIVAEERIRGITAELDETIGSLRSTIFSLNETRTQDSLSVRLMRVVQDGTGSLPSAPEVELRGPIDSAVPASVADHALAVLTEGLSNVVRHASADSVRVSAGVEDGEFELVVVDDGKGIGRPRRRSGLKNAGERASALGGTFEVGSGEDGGTRFRWAVPIPHR